MIADDTETQKTHNDLRHIDDIELYALGAFILNLKVSKLLYKLI